MQSKIDIQKMVDDARQRGLSPTDHRMRKALNLVFDNLRDDHPDFAQAPKSRTITQTGWGNVRRGRYGRVFLPWLATILFVLGMSAEDLARYIEIAPYDQKDFKPGADIEALRREIHNILTE